MEKRAEGGADSWTSSKTGVLGLVPADLLTLDWEPPNRPEPNMPPPEPGLSPTTGGLVNRDAPLSSAGAPNSLDEPNMFELELDVEKLLPSLLPNSPK